jgi:hypothetical protein
MLFQGFVQLYACALLFMLRSLRIPCIHSPSQSCLITPWLPSADAIRSKMSTLLFPLVRQYCPHQLHVVDLSTAGVHIHAF